MSDQPRRIPVDSIQITHLSTEGPLGQLFIEQLLRLRCSSDGTCPSSGVGTQTGREADSVSRCLFRDVRRDRYDGEERDRRADEERARGRNARQELHYHVV